MPKWTVFGILSVPDVDGDGVKDIVLTHGGNQSKEPEVCAHLFFVLL